MMLVNGQPGDAIPIADRGFAYGDGVFRTVRTEARQPLWWPDQYRKLAADCAALALECPAGPVLGDEIARVAGAGAAVVKIIVTRGPGARGYAFDENRAPTRIVQAAPLPAHAEAGAPSDVTARWCDLRLGHQARLAGVKHLNRLENVLARAEWRDPDIFEGLLRDTDGAVVSGVTSNLLWMKDGVLHTPDLAACGVAGVARARIVRAAAARGVDTRIGRWQPDVILGADEVMICNSVIGVRRIARLGDAVWQPAGWTAVWQQALHETPPE